MEIRFLASEETAEALALAWRVFMRFEAPDYSAEGVESFRRTIGDAGFTARIRFYGAFKGGTLIGMIATRSEGSHTALFFVEEAYHRQGIGRRLFEAILPDVPGEAVTVNASPYAVPVYRRLGFAALNEEQVTDGIRYTPMLYTRAHNA